MAVEVSPASWPTSMLVITQSPPYSRMSSRMRLRMPLSIRWPVTSTVSLTLTSATLGEAGAPFERGRQTRAPSSQGSRPPRFMVTTR